MVPSKRNVLIVDDDGETRDMLVTILSTEGFHAIAAEDGLEALHLLRAVRRGAPEAPCVVLLDLSMPRLGGNEFRRAQLNDPHVSTFPVVVMSGASDLQQRAMAMGAVPALAKPINIDLLLKVVQQYCVSGADPSRPPADRL